MSNVSSLFKDLTQVKKGKKRQVVQLGPQREKSGLLGNSCRGDDFIGEIEDPGVLPISG